MKPRRRSLEAIVDEQVVPDDILEEEELEHSNSSNEEEREHTNSFDEEDDSASYYFFETMMSPSSLSNFFKRASDRQKADIADIGFQHLLSLKTNKMPIELCHWLVSNFDPYKCSLKVGDIYVEVEDEDIYYCLGIPMGEKEVVEARARNETEDYKQVFQEWKNQWAADKRVSTCDILRKMFEQGEGGIVFKRNFVVLVVSSLLKGNKNIRCNHLILKSLINVDEIKDYNWCEYTRRSLLDSVEDWKQRPTSRFKGPIFFLLVFYLDRVVFKMRTVIRQFPLMSTWTTRKIWERFEAEKKAKSFGLGLVKGRFREDESGRTVKKNVRNIEMEEGDGGSFQEDHYFTSDHGYMFEGTFEMEHGHGEMEQNPNVAQENDGDARERHRSPRRSKGKKAYKCAFIEECKRIKGITKEEKMIADWAFADSNDEGEIVFENDCFEIPRGSIQTLVAEVDLDIVDVWAYLQNLGDESKSRFLTSMINADEMLPLAKKRSSEACKKIVEILDEDVAKADPGDMSKVQLLIFPVVMNDHTFLICFNFRKSKIEVIDVRINTTRIDYLQIASFLQTALSTFLTKEKKKKMANLLKKFSYDELEMPWVTTDASANFVLLLMKYMETYNGDVDGLKVGFRGFDDSVAKKLQIKYCVSILTSEANMHKEKIKEKAYEFAEAS